MHTDVKTTRNSVFGDDFYCRLTWRSYQKEILDELEKYLHDERLHVVAAPGSGKTILGIEVMRRIGVPTLILAPTIAIQQQWVERLAKHFTKDGNIPNWVSLDIYSPSVVTISTYQALHSMMSSTNPNNNNSVTIDSTDDICAQQGLFGGNYLIHTQSADMADNEENKNTQSGRMQVQKLDPNILRFQKQKLGLIIFDEAHHLRREWWKSLMKFLDYFKGVHRVSLTATPPYDVDPDEWDRYTQISGPVDAEISVPELVAQNNLCPHQDLLHLSTLTKKEKSILRDFNKRTNAFIDELQQNQILKDVLVQHPYIMQHEQHIEEILKNPEYVSSIIVFLHSTGIIADKKLVRLISGGLHKVPKLDLFWVDTLLQGMLYADDYIQYKSETDTAVREMLQAIKYSLRSFGALEKRKVLLHDATLVKVLTANSISKLSSILQIISHEHTVLKDDLRAVILDDFIRKEYLPNTKQVPELNRIGVVPIFEYIRRNYDKCKRLNMILLTGSVLLIPAHLKDTLLKTAQRFGVKSEHITFSEAKFDDYYVHVYIQGAHNKNKVAIITSIFNAGESKLIVGTLSLLGEGWDAPSINTLILASNVGSFMLSNQVRGRAIRIDPSKKDKVSNIWHLATVVTGTHYPGHDYNVIKRRFKAFVGVSFVNDVIESGFERLGILKPPFTDKYIKRSNKTMFEYASMRANMGKRWKHILSHGTVKKLIHEFGVAKANVPRALAYVGVHAYLGLIFVFGYLWIGNFFEMVTNPRMHDIPLSFIFLAATVAVIVMNPHLPIQIFKAMYYMLRYGAIESNMYNIANALLLALADSGIIQTDVQQIRIVVEKDSEHVVYAGIHGGTTYEKTLFVNALSEILSRIKNPRYIIKRSTPITSFFMQIDYIAVPTILGTHKKYAQYFVEHWKRLVGPAKLIYTRTASGRKELLYARRNSLANMHDTGNKRDRWM